jgi:hypothetical protein
VAGLGLFYQKSAPALAWRGYDNFVLLVIFCACSMQNVPGGSVMFQMDFRVKLKVLPSKRVLGPRLAVVTSSPYTKT